MRMRRKKNLTPRMDACAAIWAQDAFSRRGNWLAEREQTALHLEIGCGKGQFTADTAAANPQVLLVAIERVANAMVIAMERTVAQNLKNVLFLDFFLSMGAANLTELFAPREVQRIYINFCDPWPGPRHAKRRLVAPAFLNSYKKVLAPGGEIHFKTDNAPLFVYALEQFAATGYQLSEVTKDLHKDGIAGVMTDYEQKFHIAGTAICRCVARWDGVQQ